jgi:pyruvate ferredoxin oxidoreductase gamma subunit
MVRVSTMYRIRFHGRGGQGIKTASRILGTAFFREGFQVQDAPRYGAERRGAPVFAYVRAAREPIRERGIIRRPDLVVVADDTLVPVATAGVMAGITATTTLLIASLEPVEVWCKRLNTPCRLLMLPDTDRIRGPTEHRFVGATCAGAAARLVGVVSRDALQAAVAEELAETGSDTISKNREKALEAFDLMAAHTHTIVESGAIPAAGYQPPDWVTLPFEDARTTAPAIHAMANSVQVATGLWRTLRPVIDRDRCNRCWWVCSTFCPDNAITVTAEGEPRIDYDHCKGCMICVAQCPPHAIRAIPEDSAATTPNAGAPS